MSEIQVRLSSLLGAMTSAINTQVTAVFLHHEQNRDPMNSLG